MTSVTNTTQLSIFDTLVTIIRGSSTISTVFAVGDFYQYEPKHKSRSFSGFPYFLIQLPSLDTNLLVINNTKNLKEFIIPIFIRMEYSARDNMLSYANAVIRQIESSESTFEGVGYYSPRIDLIGINGDQVIDSKELVEAEFQLTLTGCITR